MHIADALLSPAIGTVMWAAAAGALAYSSVKIKKEANTRKIPLMGVMGAFIFAAQMINFTIPGTGSSGHLGGGMLLAVLLGPYSGFLTMSAVLIIQALLFADGGLLALGCNMINLGFFPCFIVYPFIYQKLKNGNPASFRGAVALFLSVILSMQLGSLGVVLETLLSGITALQPLKFTLLMQLIHLAISLVEALVTFSLLAFLYKARPDLFINTGENKKPARSGKTLFALIFTAALVTGGFLSWFAATQPDGLEWALLKTTGKTELPLPDNALHSALETVQEKTALLPDYNFKNGEESTNTLQAAGTSFSGIAGAVLTLGLLVAAGLLLKLSSRKKSS